jgi:hypothetical protein
MYESDDFLGFEDFLHFCAFTTKVIYNLIPIIFFVQLFNKVIIANRISVIAILSLYFNGLIYFWTSVLSKSNKDIQDVNPLDFCNMIGFYLGAIYLVLYHYFLYFENNIKRFIISIVILLVISIVVVSIIYTKVKDQENTWYKIFNWFLGTFFNIFENFPLGFDLFYLIKNKISEKYTLFGATAGAINTTVWIIWAVKKVIHKENRTYSIVANSIGLCLHILQYILVFVFKKNDEANSNDNNISINRNEDLITKRDDEEEEGKNTKDSELIEDFM